MVTDDANKYGMLISLPGVLNRAAECCRKSKQSRHLEHPLKELLRHLEAVREKPERVQEFMSLWVND
jgi:hypothetical protein